MRRRILAAMLVIAATVLPPTTATATTADPQVVTGTTVHGMMVFLSADPATVRSLGDIPERWKLRLDGRGRAQLFMDTGLLSMTINGRTRTVIYTQLAAILDSDQLPVSESSRDDSNVAGMPFNTYLLSWDWNDEEFADWLRADTGLGSLVRYAPNLSYDYSASPALSLGAFPPAPTFQHTIAARVPATSPFDMTGTTTQSFFPITPPTMNFWRETRVGSVLVEVAHPDPAFFGVFQSWQVAPSPASLLGRLVGPSQARSCDTTALLSPIPALLGGDVEVGCMANTWFNVPGTWRKDLP